jgi:drug/metabolite transporter (DMT)-like permease
MAAGMGLFAVVDTLAKWLVAAHPVPQILAVRSGAALLILLPFVWRAGWRTFATDEPYKHALRAGLVIAEVAFFYLAIRHMALAEVMLVYFAAPLFVTALAGPILGETVGWRRWSAVLLGFLGVYLVLEPSGNGVSTAGLVALAGSLAFALVMVSTRKLRAAGGLVLITYQTAGVLVASSVAVVVVPGGWAPTEASSLALFAVVGVGSMIAYYLVNRSLVLAPAAIVAPFNYTSIVWALGLGYLVFGDMPTQKSLAGGAIIVVAGLYNFYKESRVGRPMTPVAE